MSPACLGSICCLLWDTLVWQWDCGEQGRCSPIIEAHLLLNIINTVCDNQCTVVFVRSHPIYSLLLNDISSLHHSRNKLDRSYILMIFIAVNDTTPDLLG